MKYVLSCFTFVLIAGCQSFGNGRQSSINEDERIEQRSAIAIRENFSEKEHVNVVSYNRQVLLTGEVPSDRVRAQVEQLIGKIENIRLVVNELGIGPLQL